MTAFLIVSIDVELRWGYRFYPTAPLAVALKDHEDRALSVVRDFLDLFDNCSVPATWAIVGKVFYEHQEILSSIRAAAMKHEIGYHSFSHLRFSEINRTAAITELKEVAKIQDEFDVRLKSFVFPENKIGHIDLLAEYGFSIYRGPNNAGANVNKRLPIRAKNHVVFSIAAPPVTPRWNKTIWEIPGSMQFYNVPIFQTLTVPRAKRGIKKAMKAGSVFHLWFHPENALIDPKLLDRLGEVLQFVKKKAEEGELRPISMGDYAEVISRSQAQLSANLTKDSRIKSIYANDS